MVSLHYWLTTIILALALVGMAATTIGGIVGVIATLDCLLQLRVALRAWTKSLSDAEPWYPEQD